MPSVRQPGLLFLRAVRFRPKPMATLGHQDAIPIPKSKVGKRLPKLFMSTAEKYFFNFGIFAFKRNDVAGRKG